MQRGRSQPAWREQGTERRRKDLGGQKDSNQRSDKGVELSGISLTLYLLFFFLPHPKSLGVGCVGVFCILYLSSAQLSFL